VTDTVAAPLETSPDPLLTVACEYVGDFQAIGLLYFMARAEMSTFHEIDAEAPTPVHKDDVE